MTSNEIPVFLESAYTVTHCMRIFTHNIGPIHIRVILSKLIHFFGRWIHRGNDVSVPLYIHLPLILPWKYCTFMLYRSGFVSIFYPSISIIKIYTITGFITHTPNYYGWMIFIPFNHSGDPLHMSFAPGRIIRQCSG